MPVVNFVKEFPMTRDDGSEVVFLERSTFMLDDTAAELAINAGCAELVAPAPVAAVPARATTAEAQQPVAAEPADDTKVAE